MSAELTRAGFTAVTFLELDPPPPPHPLAPPTQPPTRSCCCPHPLLVLMCCGFHWPILRLKISHSTLKGWACLLGARVNDGCWWS